MAVLPLLISSLSLFSLYLSKITVMKNLLTAILILLFSNNAISGELASARCRSFGKGMNLSNWLEAYWQNPWPGANNYSFRDIQDMKDAGIESLRIPVYLAGVTDTAFPHQVNGAHPLFSHLDSAISWGRSLGMKIIIDNHHGWPLLNNNWRQKAPAFCNAWAYVAKRYHVLNPDSVVFELLNEPTITGLEQDSLNALFLQAIDSIRIYAPEHSIVVSPILGSAGYGYTGYQPLPDTNLIYTFHCYDPLNFTHQGLSWANPSAPAGTPFPDPNNFLEQLLYTSWETVSAWQDSFNQPVFLGEFGISRPTYPEHRCNWIRVMGEQIRRTNMPWFYWDWRYDFPVFYGQGVDPDSVIPCMKSALGLYGDNSFTGIEDENEKTNISLYPQPACPGQKIVISAQSDEQRFMLSISDLSGKIMHSPFETEENVFTVPDLPAGFYLLQLTYEDRKYVRKLMISAQNQP
jgi:endoglucanase